MSYGLWIIYSSMFIMALVLFLPLLSKRVEEKLEAFLLIMGVLSVTTSNMWSWHLLKESFVEPIKITLAVLIVGLVLRTIRSKIIHYAHSIANKLGYHVLIFIIVLGLGLLSSVMTAIIAALLLSEILINLNFTRPLQTKVAVIACFAIGLGAVLTPLGEPLATIAIYKLRGEPHNATFFFLFKHLYMFIIPAVFALAAYAAFCTTLHTAPTKPSEDKNETITAAFYRAFRVYIFVLALMFLGTGFTPFTEQYLVNVSSRILYWVNISSAVLDNATLTAAEISPQMPLETIVFLLMGLLIAGGMLIPGNIPNIICANKLSIRSKEWAKLGVPLGMILMVAFFIILILVSPASH